MDLTKRRDEILTEHRSQVKHDPAWKGTDLAERPVAFLCDDQVVLVGDCVGKVLAGLRAFFDKVGADRELLTARLAQEPAFAQAVEKARAVLEAPPAAELRVPQQSWNALTYALAEAGAGVVLADGKAAVKVSLLDLLRKGD